MGAGVHPVVRVADAETNPMVGPGTVARIPAARTGVLP